MGTLARGSLTGMPAATALAFLEKAVNIRSGTFNEAGVRAVGKLFARLILDAVDTTY